MININTKTSTPASTAKPVVNKPAAVANTKTPTTTTKAPTPPAKSSATVVSLNQAKNADLGLYNKSGVTKPITTSNSATPTNTSAEPSGFVASGGDVVVDVKSSDSGYQNKIYWSTDNFKTKNYIGVDNNQASVNIGSFAKGTKVEFGIENDAKQFFRTGAGAANTDQQVHAKITTNGSGTEIGFEDLFGGGDNDFNDAIIQVHNVASKIPNTTTNQAQPKIETKPAVKAATTAAPKIESKPIVKAEPKIEAKPVTKAEPKVTAKPVTQIEPKTTQTNRSGLGDGTNPGQGAGTTKSLNQGTNNPSKTAAYTSKPVTNQFKIAV